MGGNVARDLMAIAFDDAEKIALELLLRRQTYHVNHTMSGEIVSGLHSLKLAGLATSIDLGERGQLWGLTEEGRAFAKLIRHK